MLCSQRYMTKQDALHRALWDDAMMLRWTDISKAVQSQASLRAKFDAREQRGVA